MKNKQTTKNRNGFERSYLVISIVAYKCSIEQPSTAECKASCGYVPQYINVMVHNKYAHTVQNTKSWVLCCNHPHVCTFLLYNNSSLVQTDITNRHAIRGNLTLIKAMTNTNKPPVVYWDMQIWNVLSEHITQERRKIKFKSLVKQYLFNRDVELMFELHAAWVVQWLALLPRSKNAPGLIPSRGSLHVLPVFRCPAQSKTCT